MNKNKSVISNSRLSLRNVLTNGIQAGIFTVAFWLILHAMVPGIHPLPTYLGYTILAYFLFRSIIAHQAISRNGRFFENGIRVGLGVSTAAAITTVVVNSVSYAILPEMAITKFGQELTDNVTFMSTSFGILFEMFVVGMIVTFIILQGHKQSSSGRVKNNIKDKTQEHSYSE